jgi:hypothetical protein
MISNASKEMNERIKRTIESFRSYKQHMIIHTFILYDGWPASRPAVASPAIKDK